MDREKLNAQGNYRVTHPDKRTKLGMFEKLRDNFLFKLNGILYDKGFTIFGPACHSWITSVYHVVRLCNKHKGGGGNGQQDVLTHNNGSSKQMFMFVPQFPHSAETKPNGNTTKQANVFPGLV